MIHETELEQTLGQLAVEHPASIAEFERHGLDYCCGGRRTLREACLAAGVDPGVVLAAIRAGALRPEATAERNWADATMTELADHIEQTHHAFTRDVLGRLANVIPRVVAAHAEAHPELHELADVVKNLSEEMHDHMIREDRVVFPWLRRRERPSEIQGGPPWSVRRPISCMIHDHDDAGEALAKLRSLTNDFAPPTGACMTYRSMLGMLLDFERDMHTHIHKENNILFPAGIAAEDRMKLRRSRGGAYAGPEGACSASDAGANGGAA